MELTVQDILDQYREGKRHFSEVELEDGDLRDQDLPGIIFDACYMAIDFRDTNLRGAKFLNSNIKTCDFRGADLTDAHFENSLVDGTEFAGAKADGTVFKDNTYHSFTLQQEDFEEWINEESE